MKALLDWEEVIGYELIELTPLRRDLSFFFNFPFPPLPLSSLVIAVLIFFLTSRRLWTRQCYDNQSIEPFKHSWLKLFIFVEELNPYPLSTEPPNKPKNMKLKACLNRTALSVDRSNRVEWMSERRMEKDNLKARSAPRLRFQSWTRFWWVYWLMFQQMVLNIQ